MNVGVRGGDGSPAEEGEGLPHRCVPRNERTKSLTLWGVACMQASEVVSSRCLRRTPTTETPVRHFELPPGK
jgi:hypothetical protein